MALNPTDLNTMLNIFGIADDNQTKQNQTIVDNTIDNVKEGASTLAAKAENLIDTITTIFQSIGKGFEKIIDNWQLVLIGIVAFILIRRI